VVDTANGKPSSLRTDQPAKNSASGWIPPFSRGDDSIDSPFLADIFCYRPEESRLLDLVMIAADRTKSELIGTCRQRLNVGD
jgi:hypothetical protein